MRYFGDMHLRVSDIKLGYAVESLKSMMPRANSRDDDDGLARTVLDRLTFLVRLSKNSNYKCEISSSYLFLAYCTVNSMYTVRENHVLWSKDDMRCSFKYG